jgi:hypothetical protein
MSAWRRSPLVAVVVLVLFLLIQAAVPISRLGDHERADRFGWQMFSVHTEAPRFVVVTNHGTTEISLGDYMARVRGDIDIVDAMPPHLCEIVDGAVRVTWQTGSFEC